MAPSLTGSAHMADTDADFTGSIPEIYHRRLGPMLFEPFALELSQRLFGRAGYILELACGTGVVTRALALCTQAQIMATDLNPAMLDYARSRLDRSQIDWRQADAVDLPFGPALFDVVVCQFGVMFFPDRVAAHRETRRVLRRPGTYIFSVWDSLDHNPAAAATHAAVASCFPADPPQFLARTPHGYSDAGRIQADLVAAGYHRMAVDTVMRETQASAADLAIGFCQGSPLRAEILARDPEGLQRVTDVVQAALAAQFGDDGFSTVLQAYVVTATQE